MTWDERTGPDPLARPWVETLPRPQRKASRPQSRWLKPIALLAAGIVVLAAPSLVPARPPVSVVGEAQ